MTVVHEGLVWRERSNFFINAALPGEDDRFEQLWVRRVADSRFEWCCIPFFCMTWRWVTSSRLRPRAVVFTC